jgi:hypothetical protein
MASKPLPPHIRSKAEKVYDLLRKKGLGPGIFRDWLSTRPIDPKVSDSELDALYSQLLSLLGGDADGEGDGKPPPQKERQRGVGGTER